MSLSTAYTVLTDKGYVDVNELQKGDYVKTFKSGTVKVYGVGKRIIHNPAIDLKIKDQLYILKHDSYPELTSNLIVMGYSSILVDKIPDGKRYEVKKTLGTIYLTEGKYRLPVCVDDRSVIYHEKGEQTVYHICLENNSNTANYGIYVNGALLVDTCCIKYFNEHFLN
jgi:hypothetical protein